VKNKKRKGTLCWLNRVWLPFLPRKYACKETEKGSNGHYRKGPVNGPDRQTRISPNQKSGKHQSAQVRKDPVTLNLPATVTVQKPKLATPSKN
jgi:hypothetical protein